MHILQKKLRIKCFIYNSKASVGGEGVPMLGNQSIKRDKSYWPVGQGQNFQLSKKYKMFKKLFQMSKNMFQLSKNLFQLSKMSHFRTAVHQVGGSATESFAV